MRVLPAARPETTSGTGGLSLALTEPLTEPLTGKGQLGQ